jgi:quinohemoprotein ethanol dehydrogenase
VSISLTKLSEGLLYSLFLLFAGAFHCSAHANTNDADSSVDRAYESPSDHVVLPDENLLNPKEASWPAHGRTPWEQRFSPLEQIDTTNVAELGLAWSYDLPTTRGVEATPLAVDGMLYTAGSWSVVYAFDARTGALQWSFDPEVPRERLQFACCGPVNRGVAIWKDRVFVATLDGRLIALRRQDGRELWSVNTLINDTDPYTITGAPRVVNDKVVIGNGGAEMGVRGYVSAFNAESGALIWRFFTVPGNPEDGHEDKIQEWIASTWTGEWWKQGGGGTAWDSFAFDPEQNLLYIGVGNGSPWNQKIRSPGGGDNLFLASIVAVDADTGRYVWHYQTTPGETWDYTATQHMILADMEFQGRTRQVIMQAPKNGFFYVLDRVSGELLLAENYVDVSWASYVDMQTGRPVEHPRARSGDGKFKVRPAGAGAHNWNPMAYSPHSGLVYVPARDISTTYLDDFVYQQRKTIYNINYSAADMASVPDYVPVWLRQLILKWKYRGFLLAIDPRTGKEIWRRDQGIIAGGGVLATAGGLVFQGNMEGLFSAYDATNGERLWSFQTENGIMGGPISFAVDGVQYVAVMQGWGGIAGLSAGMVVGPDKIFNVSRLLVFRLAGDARLSEIATREEELSKPSLPIPDRKEVEQGRELYAIYCMACHGGNAISGSVVPDLRFRVSELAPLWDQIVLNGMFSAGGMPAWREYLSEEESRQIRDYIVFEAAQGHRRGEKRTLRK